MQEILRLSGCAPGVKLLDVGCGNGELVRIAKAIGCQARGLDFRHDVARLARSRSGQGQFIVANATRLPFRSESLDVVVAQHVVEHLSNPEIALSEWRRVLRPHGRLAVMTPNSRYPDPSIYRDPDHVRIYDPRNLGSLLDGARMRTLCTKTIFPYVRGHIVFGFRHYRLFSSIPLFSSRGRSLLCVAERT